MKILNSSMRKKVTIHCLFWIFWYQDQRTVLKHLFTTNQLLVGYILTSIVSFATNIKLIWFLLCYLEHFQLSLTFPGFTRKSFKGNFKKECVSCQKLFWIKHFCILSSHWLLRKNYFLLPYHILVIYLLL